MLSLSFHVNEANKYSDLVVFPPETEKGMVIFFYKRGTFSAQRSMKKAKCF